MHCALHIASRCRRCAASAAPAALFICLTQVTQGRHPRLQSRCGASAPATVARPLLCVSCGQRGMRGLSDDVSGACAASCARHGPSPSRALRAERHEGREGVCRGARADSLIGSRCSDMCIVCARSGRLGLWDNSLGAIIWCAATLRGASGVHSWRIHRTFTNHSSSQSAPSDPRTPRLDPPRNSPRPGWRRAAS